jgi:hypothetical protein
MLLKNAYIRFNTPQDSVLGTRELVNHSQCACLSNEIYCVPWDSLTLLDDLQIEYSFATEDSLTHAQPIWNIAEVKSR